MIDISKYRRPGIFFEIVNSSTLETTPVQVGITNLVPGFSRKGVFNRPVLLNNTFQREAVFGPIDKSLEKKGSFFHRTIDVLLQSGPVWGLNLLNATDDDQLNFASISLAPQYDNLVDQDAEYDNFFDKSGFWVRDTESFLNTTNSDTSMLHITNMGDKKVTVFFFKDKLAGYDVTMESWYGSRDKVPTYLYPTDWVSDYMARFIVVGGDWSDYLALANDPTWGKYFNATGLIKDKVTDFVNQKNVNVLFNEIVSLIPYFLDRNGRNIFIETIVNRSTDTTGVFAAFNTDAFETDLPNGLVDLVGHTLVYLKNRPTDAEDKVDIDFMSYQDTVQETDDFEQTLLDRLGNVVGIGSISTRTTAYSPGNLDGLVVNESAINADTSADPTITVTSTSGYAIFGSTQVDVDTQSVQLAAVAVPSTVGNSNYRTAVLYLASDGTLNAIESTVVQDTSGQFITTITGFPSSYPNSAIVIGYVTSEIEQNGTITNTYLAVAMDGSGFVPLTIGTSGTDIVLASTSNDTIDATFTATGSVAKTDYAAWRRKQFFDALVAAKSSESTIIDASQVKRAVSTGTWTDNSSDTAADKNITLTIPSSTIRVQVLAGNLVFYASDDEFKMGTETLVTKNTVATSTEGVVAKYSNLYEKYYQGRVKTGDYFYLKIADLTDVRFVSHTDGFDYFIVPNAQVQAEFIQGYKIWVTGHSANNGLFTMTADGETTVTDLTLTSETAYRVSQNVTTTTVEDVSVYSYDDKVYLKMYTANDVLNVEFYADATFVTPYTISSHTADNQDISVYSDEAAYSQTVEIETPDGYTMTDNKVLVLAARYPEIIVGSFLEAYVDYDALEVTEVPKSFTRIVSKKPWSEDATYVELTTDAKIAVTAFGTDYQTTAYSYVDSYVDTYKGIVLNAFTVRAASMPDGTEDRQTEILGALDSEGGLFKALTNRNKISWRYLVDSFGLGLDDASKQELVDVCGERKACLGFINMPSVKSFKNSSSPSFVDSEGNLVTDYLKTGGNLEDNPTFLYTFAEGDQQQYVGYFTPYVTVNDNGRPLNMPPAAFVANTYMRKNNTRRSGIYRWTIAAGIEDGLVTGISNLEYDYTDDDIVNLSDMGANAIRYSNGDGFYLETEWTAARNPLSSLSYLHSIEVLIELENELYRMLLKYQWKFNTSAIRSEIKRKADDICRKFVDRSALYAYLNIIDESNNTDELIDNQFGLLETYIEIIKGMGVIVNTINVMRKGGIASLLSTGFVSAQAA